MAKHDVGAPLFTAIVAFFAYTLVFLLGTLRDKLGWWRRRAKQGYAPIRDPHEDFYQRRLFSRIRDLWNRPIASAPDAWIDVMERTDISYTNGLGKLELLSTTKHCLNLGSYNYLGFAASDKYCTPRVQQTLTELGISTCSSRLAAGTTPVHVELEEQVAKYVGKEAAITFGMGFATNSATIPALVGKDCLVLSDQLNHSSIVAGARASGAKVKVFRHNDVEHLEAVLRDAIASGQSRTHRPWKKALIVVEGIYSMEGDVCALRDIVAVKKKYGAYLYLDEAHSIGALGAHGKGVCEHWGVDPADVDVMMGTFTKSFGSCGGYIAATREIIDYLLRHSPAHLYATAMAPAAVQQVLSAIKLINGDDGTSRGLDKVRQLHTNANYFRRRLLDMDLHVLGDWDSPVMPIMIYHPFKMPGFSRLCLQRHVAMVVVGPPATEMLLARARVCISASHTQDDLEYALHVIREVGRLCCMEYGVVKAIPEPQPHPTQPENIPSKGLPSYQVLAQQMAHSGLLITPGKVRKSGVRMNGVRAAAHKGLVNGPA